VKEASVDDLERLYADRVKARDALEAHWQNLWRTSIGPDRSTDQPEQAMDASWRERYHFLRGVLDQLEEEMLAFKQGGDT
jgi:hypothetical protein